MSVRLTFECNGCTAKEEGTAPLNWALSAQAVAPAGWIAIDPYTSVTYCPACWASIMTPNPKEV